MDQGEGRVFEEICFSSYSIVVCVSLKLIIQP